MSSYINFFLKKDLGEQTYFIPLGCFSRSSYIYQAFQDAPWEKIRALDTTELDHIIDSLQDDKETYEDNIDTIEKHILTVIPQFNNSAQEKMEMITDEQNTIRDYQEDIVSIQYSIGYLEALKEIEYNNPCDSPVLYYGLEISEPTKENIV